MTSQQRDLRRQQHRPVTRPMVLGASLALALLVAVACVGLVTARAIASPRAATTAGKVKDLKGTKPGTPSPAPPAAAPAGPKPSAAPPLAQLPPLNTPTPSPSPTPTPTPTPSPTPTPTPTPSPTPSPTATDTPSPTDTATDRGTPTTATAPSGPEADRVGALFSGSATDGNHFCTASVVQSATRNLLVTAAHCVGNTNGLVFAPAFRNGQTPYGVWQVTQLYTTNGWTQSQDPDQDFAFLEVAPLNGKQIQDVVGGNPLGLNESFTATVRLYGYPNSSDAPILCSNATTQQSTYQREIACPGYPSGTSGGPWINTADGNLIGIIGGYQQGGNSPDISYSAYFDQTIGNLYQLAVSSSG